MMEPSSIWDRLLADFPDLQEKNEIRYWLAEASLSKQDPLRAMGYVDRLKEDPVLYPKGLNSLGWYHFQRGEWKEANRYFMRLLEEFPALSIRAFPFPSWWGNVI